MITVNTKRLAEAVMEAEVFKLPDMTDGARYIYDEIYGRLSHGEETRLSGINFGAFEIDDVDFMRDLYSNTLEPNEYKAETMTHTLRSLPPVTTATAFV